MKYLSIFLVMLITFSMAGAAWYPQKVNVPVTNYDNITLVDDKYMFFGTDADTAISYDSSQDKWYVNDTDVYLEEDVTIAGNLGVSGTTISNGKTTDPFYVNDLFYVSDTAALNATTATTVTATGLIQGADGRLTDDFLVDDDAYVDGTATLNDAVVNTTLDVNGATTTAAITVDSGSIVTADQYKRRTVTSATNFTITDGGADVYLVGNGTGVNTQTILFPTAADNKGRIITVIVATDPLANTVILDGENSETIDTAATKTTTDAVGSMYHLICNGYAWIKIASLGTWS